MNPFNNAAVPLARPLTVQLETRVIVGLPPI